MNENRPQAIDACQELQNLLPAYVIGATTPEEAKRVQELLPQCPDVTQELQSYAQIGVSLMQQVTPVIPPATLRAKLLDRLDEQSSDNTPIPTLSPRVTKIRWQWLAAILIIILISANVYLISELTAVRNTIEGLQAQNNQMTSLLANSQLQQFPLLDTSNEDGTILANLLWDEQGNEATLVTDQLTLLGNEQTYQVWLIDGETPVSAGLFQVDAQNRSLLTIDLNQELEQFVAVAISIEPASGSPAPTTDPIAIGEIDL